MSTKYWDIKAEPKTALEAWHRWKNYMASIAVKPRKKIEVKNG